MKFCCEEMLVSDFFILQVSPVCEYYHRVLVTEKVWVVAYSRLVILPPVLSFELNEWLESCSGLRR